VRALSSYDYALIRLVPSVERGECLNVGVILFSSTERFLAMRVHLDVERALALDPGLDLEAVRQQLDDLARICAGGEQASAIGAMSQSERFHWLVSPRSTIIQVSPVHVGVSSNHEAALEHLLKTMVYR
jgi:hypothetical protein